MHHLARCFVQQSRHFIQDGGIVADDAKIFRNFASECQASKEALKQLKAYMETKAVMRLNDEG